MNDDHSFTDRANLYCFIILNRTFQLYFLKKVYSKNGLSF
ncbi:hypothetical protein LEP1GSC173_2850 [Leptospira interrogans str. HAI1594]|uniref:Uncharacterized protein n=4 Tax=Leptospira interrogans TaxID=173 RepID=M6ZIB2_LEPIR|nr:hypothetical protein LEP1GSC173_2850 [Leptospira interrogans str. HAI1594]EKP84640.1 hypothetical protein LEP1GSC020_4756 [Leptospira interrogans serovar Grippotyphosa str. 2006006986]EKR19094.1 hypothetical protein LEP1GSC019_0440 [Leptospira interrogans serovar Pyrogenes str. 2006006960]EMF71012.1 hypothetical protein LEP1GSC148_3936 [Leptospira interrogans serovar Canicola str. LT1962]EMM90678.1 hypothetical protein LEP1GSC145_3290 [Leptospira interrogans serovar Djasiman str. LT1649]EMM